MLYELLCVRATMLSVDEARDLAATAQAAFTRIVLARLEPFLTSAPADAADATLTAAEAKPRSDTSSNPANIWYPSAAPCIACRNAPHSHYCIVHD